MGYNSRQQHFEAALHVMKDAAGRGLVGVIAKYFQSMQSCLAWGVLHRSQWMPGNLAALWILEKDKGHI